MILFNEFVEWAVRKNLDLDDDDNLDQDEDVRFQSRAIKKQNLPK
jgi:hypothetical protein